MHPAMDASLLDDPFVAATPSDAIVPHHPTHHTIPAATWGILPPPPSSPAATRTAGKFDQDGSDLTRGEQHNDIGLKSCSLDVMTLKTMHRAMDASLLHDLPLEQPPTSLDHGPPLHITNDTVVRSTTSAIRTAGKFMVHRRPTSQTTQWCDVCKITAGKLTVHRPTSQTTQWCDVRKMSFHIAPPTTPYMHLHGIHQIPNPSPHPPAAAAAGAIRIAGNIQGFQSFEKLKAGLLEPTAVVLLS
nr:unnamed protein product [Digitaria exilis]